MTKRSHGLTLVLSAALAVSLGINAVLARVGMQPARGHLAIRITDTSVLSPARPNPGTPGDPRLPAPTVDFSWTEVVAANDLESVVAEMRAAGFPPTVLRATVEALVRRRNAALRADLSSAYSERVATGSEAELLARQRARDLDREEREWMRRLLGADADTPEQWARVNLEYGFLPEAKRMAIDEVVREFEARKRDWDQAASGAPLPGDMEARRAVQKDLEAKLERLLTPDEVALFDITCSPSAREMRFWMKRGGIEVSPAEMREIVGAWRAFDEEYVALASGWSPVSRQSRDDAGEVLKMRIAEILGPERGLQYRYATDSNYDYARRIAEHMQLPPELAGDVYAIKEAVRQEIATIANRFPNDPAARSNAYRELGANAFASVQAVLTSDGASALREVTYWLRLLEEGRAPYIP